MGFEKLCRRGSSPSISTLCYVVLLPLFNLHPRLNEKRFVPGSSFWVEEDVQYDVRFRQDNVAFILPKAIWATKTWQRFAGAELP